MAFIKAMEYKDYYKILGLDRSADQAQIKRAYRKLARKYHPDVSKEEGAEEHFKEVNEAYEVLKDPEKRAAYDQLGSGFQSGQDFRPPPIGTRVLSFTVVDIPKLILKLLVTSLKACLAAAGFVRLMGKGSAALTVPRVKIPMPASQ
ncbi:DnaJ domain-containing protein [Microbulbifer sp. MKSA007]|nr:DnaJ domain-containing protein [Microbulbifer sp. MKSA007]